MSWAQVLCRLPGGWVLVRFDDGRVARAQGRADPGWSVHVLNTQTGWVVTAARR